MKRPSWLLVCSLSFSLGCGGSSDEDAAPTAGGEAGGGASGGGAAGGAGSPGAAGSSGKGSAGAGGAAGNAGAGVKGGAAGGAGGAGSPAGSGGQPGGGAGNPAAGAGGNPESGGAGAGGSTAGAGSAGAGGDPGAGGAGAGGAAGAAGGGPACLESLKDYPDGSVTFYDLGGTAVNCSFDVVSQKPDVIAHVPFGGGQFFGAMNTTDYDSAGVCGACVEVTRKDSGKSVSLVIVDQCPSDSNPVCKSGHIDMSRAAFLQIGTEAEGYLGTTNGGATGQISWKYVACPAMENISFRLKEPSNQYWNQILVAGHRYPITRLEAFVGGSWQEGVRQSYNYWQVGDGNLGAPPYQVRVTDASGSVIEASLALVAGDQASSAQFPLCQ